MFKFLNGIEIPHQNIYLILISIWILFWKGISLWKSAKQNQKYWFISLLLFNTLGILEIIYISFFQKNNKSVFINSISINIKKLLKITK